MGAGRIRWGQVECVGLPQVLFGGGRGFRVQVRTSETIRAYKSVTTKAINLSLSAAAVPSI